MSPAAYEVAARLVAHPRFAWGPWALGLWHVHAGYAYVTDESDIDVEGASGGLRRDGSVLPILDHPATVGVLLAHLRREAQDPYAHTHPRPIGSLVGPLRYMWVCKVARPGDGPVRTRLVDSEAETEGEAVALALLACWDAT